MQKLSKLEMKKITGGVQEGHFACGWTWAPGYTGDIITSCEGSAVACQAAADSWCWAHDECLDVDCR